MIKKDLKTETSLPIFVFEIAQKLPAIKCHLSAKSN